MRIKIKNKAKLLLIGLYTAIILTACLAVYKSMRAQDVLASFYDVSFNQYEGPADAPKVIVEFLDYRCSYCRDVHPILQEVLARNPDVKIIYRHYPILGRPSIIEAEVALAAGMQGKFIEAHHDLVSREEPITEREIDELAHRLGLDVDQFRIDMKDQGMGYYLLNTLDTAQILKIKATPTFIIGDEKLELDEGMPTPETFEKLLAQEYGSP